MTRLSRPLLPRPLGQLILLPWGPGLLALLLTGGAIWPTLASDSAGVRERLQAVQADIHDLQRSREAAAGRRGELQARLRKTELQIAALDQASRAKREAITAHAERLETLQTVLATEQSRLESQRAELAEQIQSRYLAGRQAGLQLLLSQDRAAPLGRLLGYLRYWLDHRIDSVVAVRESLQAVRQTRQSLQRTRAKLAGERADLLAKRQALADQRQQRAATLAELEQTMRTKDTRLSELRANETRLQELLASLRRQLADVPADMGERSLASARGALPWPVQGRLTQHYGDSRSGARHWQGIFIAAPRGQPVQAVARGRVAYADWVRRFGLLLILDHGQGFMSLYAHNQSVHRTLGEWVEAGEVIATSGDSGGLRNSGVYFELRRNGQPFDPLPWLADRGA